MRRHSEVLRDFADMHREALAHLDELITEAVPRAFSLCEAFARPTEVAGVTLGTIFREFLIQSCSAVPSSAWSGLDFSVGSNRSVVFTDYNSREVRVRKLPVDWRSRREISLPGWEPMPLFPLDGLTGSLGRAVSDGEDLVVLWRPDPASATLDRAVLASVLELAELGASRVLDFVPLTPSDRGYRVPSAEDFDDFFGSVSGLIGPEPG